MEGGACPGSLESGSMPVHETTLGSDTAATPFTLVVNEATPLNLGNKITLYEGKIVLGSAGGTGGAQITLDGSVDGVTATYQPGSNKWRDTIGGPYDVRCHTNWRKDEGVVPLSPPCKGDQLVLAEDDNDVIYAANYADANGERDPLVVKEVLWTAASEALQCPTEEPFELQISDTNGFLNLGTCGTPSRSGDIIQTDFTSFQGGSCETTCPPMMTFKEHDSGDDWTLQQMPDEWVDTESGGSWEPTYRVIKADGTIDPQEVTVTEVGEGDDMEITFEIKAESDGRSHKYSAKVNQAYAEMHTTITTTTTSTTSTMKNTDDDKGSGPGGGPGGGPAAESSEDDDGGGGGGSIGPIIGGAVGAILLLLLLVIFLRKKSDGQKAPVATISFENPVYDTNEAKENPVADGNEMLYDEPEFGSRANEGGYEDLPAGGAESGYLDVAGGDTYDDVAEAVPTTAAPAEDLYDDFGNDDPALEDTYNDVAEAGVGDDVGNYDDVPAGGYIDVTKEPEDEDE